MWLPWFSSSGTDILFLLSLGTKVLHVSVALLCFCHCHKGRTRLGCPTGPEEMRDVQNEDLPHNQANAETEPSANPQMHE